MVADIEGPPFSKSLHPPLDSSTCSTDSETLRIGNTDWCLCGRCAPMETHTESLCCKETNEIPEEYFEGDD